jgi:hypothetical protein
MAARKAQRKLKALFQKKATTGNSTKAYWRNFGKGQLEFAENSLKFYVEKGRLSKQKEMTKQISLADIESVTLESKELSVISKGITERLVIEDKTFAQMLYEKANEFLKQTQKTTEAINSAAAASLEEEKSERILGVALSIVDSLFDALISLQGLVDWKRITNCVKRGEKDLKKIAGENMFEKTPLDFSLLSLAVTEHNAELISKEGYRLLESLYGSFQTADTKSQKAKNVVQSYYALNDVILASIVGDKNVEDELKQFTTLLGTLPQETGINVGEISESLNRLIQEQGKEPYAEASRGVFKRQLVVAMP